MTREPTQHELDHFTAQGDPHLALASSEVSLVSCFCSCRYDAACHCDNFGVCDCDLTTLSDTELNRSKCENEK